MFGEDSGEARRYVENDCVRVKQMQFSQRPALLSQVSKRVMSLTCRFVAVLLAISGRLSKPKPVSRPHNKPRPIQAAAVHAARPDNEAKVASCVKTEFDMQCSQAFQLLPRVNCRGQHLMQNAGFHGTF